MAGVQGRQDQHLLLLAKRSKAGPVPLPLTFSLLLPLTLSAQGDELLVAHLPTSCFLWTSLPPSLLNSPAYLGISLLNLLTLPPIFWPDSTHK